MRFLVIFSLICATGAFILSMLCLFAGSKPNFMEDYHIITLNTSTLGYAAIDASPTSSSARPSPTSALSWLTDITDKITEEVEEVIDEVRNDIADKLAEKLGIQQWYSLHMMDMCMGTFSPNVTAEGSRKNVSRCTNVTAMYHFDPTTELNDQLASGPLAGRINLTDLGYSDDIQTGIDGLNIAMSATFVIYCIGIATAGLAMITSLIAVFVTGRLFSLFNLSLDVLAFLALGIASAIATGIMMKATDLINKYGNGVGLYAYKGTKYLAITWAATGAMLLASLAWLAIFLLGKKPAKAAEVVEEKPVEEA